MSRKRKRPLRAGWLQTEDISSAAAFLASGAAAMATGAEYEVTGGDSAHDISVNVQSLNAVRLPMRALQLLMPLVRMKPRGAFSATRRL
jgi:hypothetical protein